MKRIVLLMSLIVLVSGFLSAQEVQFRVVERARYVLHPRGLHFFYLEKNEIISCTNYTSYAPAFSMAGDSSYFLVMQFERDGERYWTEAGKLIPLDTTDTFSSDIAINHSRENREMWLPSYYADVLSSQKRDTITDFESHWLPWEAIDERTGKVLDNWHMSYEIDSDGEVIFYDAAIHMTIDYCLVIKNIQKTDYGYNVVCIGPIDDYYPDFIGSKFNWSYVPEKGLFSLLIREDGDYLDLFADNFSQRFGTLIKVQQEFARQFEQLIKTNTCDLRNVQWPKRANGSTDYPPPRAQEITGESSEPSENATVAEEGSEVTEHGEKKANALPLWVWVLISGVVVAAGVVFFVVKRRK